MSTNPGVVVAAIALLTIGCVAIVWPRRVASAISRFYGRYPLVRLAPGRQLAIRPAYVRGRGAVLLLVASLALWP